MDHSRDGASDNCFISGPNRCWENWPGSFRRFPLLLKFLDVRDTLSVQVHPSDQQTQYIPAGETGKTEAWVVLEAGTKSRIYAGLKPATTTDTLRQALANGTVADHLAGFTPKPGDGIFIPAGTVHSLGDVVVFEVQENSDVTFRLFDWNHVDARTGQPRPLQVDQAMACIDFAQGAISPVVPMVDEVKPVLRERLFDCEHFGLWRFGAESPFGVGAERTPRVLVCLAGDGQVEHDGANYAIGKGGCAALAGHGWSMFVPAARCHQLVGDFTAGRHLTHEKTHRFRSGWHAGRKQSIARCRDGQTAHRSAGNCEGGGDFRRRLATV
jgi:mannose-6-phosphate isomerase